MVVWVGAGVRLGMYEPVKRLLGGEGHGTETLAVKLGAAVLTSAAGISIAQPSDVVKVRFQAHSDLTARPYHGSLDAYRRILRDEGLLAGLYRGASYHRIILKNLLQRTFKNLLQRSTRSRSSPVYKLTMDQVVCHQNSLH